MGIKPLLWLCLYSYDNYSCPVKPKIVFHYCLCSNLPSVRNEKSVPWGIFHFATCISGTVGCNMPNKGNANFQSSIGTADFLGKCQDSLCSLLDLFKAHVTRAQFFHVMNSKVLAAVVVFYFSSTFMLFPVLALLVVRSSPLRVWSPPPCHGFHG